MEVLKAMLKKVQITNHEERAPGVYRMEFISPPLAREASPGQFIHLKVREEGYHPLLRRPFSIFSVDRERGLVSILYRVVGLGTRIMGQKLPGESLEIMGPLGKPFTLPDKGKRVLLVAGGMGFAPLNFFLEEMVKNNISGEVLLGARGEEELVGEGELIQLNTPYFLATEDGSRGFTGQVTRLLEEKLEVKTYDYIYSCGPRPMLERVVALALKKNIEGEVSLEEIMACGVGACLGCVCSIKGDKGKKTYQKVCLHGPTFSLREVLFHGKPGD